MKLISCYAWRSQEAKPAQEYIAGYLQDSDMYSGQIESMKQEIENLQEMVSFLSAALLEKNLVSLEDLNMGDVEVEED